MPSPTLALLHIAAAEPNAFLWTPGFEKALRERGDFRLLTNGQGMSKERLLKELQQAEVVLTGWGSISLPPELALEPGQVRYICHLTGTMRKEIPLEIIRGPFQVSNWRASPAGPVAEAAFALLLASLKCLPESLRAKEAGAWVTPEIQEITGTLQGLKVGIYGFGVIGRRFAELLRPFGCELSVFDPYADLPHDVRGVQDLGELFGSCDAVALHAPLNDQTRETVSADVLARLRDGGILVNTARGGLVDQAALFAELETGRIRAALDVLEPDEALEEEHPARTWPNLIMTAHRSADTTWPRDPMRLAHYHVTALENLDRYARGEPLEATMDEARYHAST